MGDWPELLCFTCAPHPGDITTQTVWATGQVYANCRRCGHRWLEDAGRGGDVANHQPTQGDGGTAPTRQHTNHGGE